jgi:hypothetical protein
LSWSNARAALNTLEVMLLPVFRTLSLAIADYQQQATLHTGADGYGAGWFGGDQV